MTLLAAAYASILSHRCVYVVVAGAADVLSPAEFFAELVGEDSYIYLGGYYLTYFVCDGATEFVATLVSAPPS